MIYILFIVLAMAFIACIALNKKDLISPSVVFTLGFLFQGVWAVLYAKTWKLGLHLNTFLVILLGVIEFIVVSQLTKYVLKNKAQINDEKEEKIEFIKINRIMEVIYLAFAIFGSVLYLYFLVKSVDGSFTSFHAISKSIAKYDSLTKFSDQFNTVKIPFIINNVRAAIVASGYWFLYVIINNFLYNRKIAIIEVFVVVICLIASIIDGSRTSAIMIIIAGICCFLFLNNKKHKFNNEISIKYISVIALIGVVFLSTFALFANLLGRNVQQNTFNYLSIYCGAEVKNLDLFLQEKNYEKSNNIIGSQTFVSLIKSYGEKIGFSGYKNYQLDLPFREANKVGLGNVYTTFYPFIYDFGYIGEFVLVGIMAFISQLLYELCKKSNFSSKPDVLILIYGIVFSCLLLSFFSNKFYENIFSMDLVKKVFVWCVFNYIFCILPIKIAVQKNAD